MKKIFNVVTFLLLAATTLNLSAPSKALAEDIKSLAEQVYIYGYPLVLMELTKQVMTAVPKPLADGRKAPVNQFGNVPTFPNPSDTDVVSPNADTLYSTAWLDLAKEPIILSLPDTHGRYYLMPMLDAWTNVFASPGARTTGTGKGDYAIIGPDWKGTLPAGMNKIYSPTRMVWIIGRTKTDGPADFPAVNALQRQYRLTPLSAWGKAYAPPQQVPIAPNMDLKIPPVDQVAKMSGPAFFETFAALLEANPPEAVDAPMVETMKKLGIVVGQPFKVDPSRAADLEAGAKSGLKKILEAAHQPVGRANGWKIMVDLGQYGTRYLQRAMVALVGLGANLSADAVYPMTRVDAQGKAFSGANRYTLHFDRVALPPVRGFWSLTMYNNEQFFVANPVNRYAIGDRNPLKKNADGSIDLYIQNENPGPDKEANWLPAPKDGFNLILRLYWPESQVLNGIWKPPPVQVAN